MSHWEFFRGKRILVTGGAGFLGSNLSLRLAKEGADVLAVDSFFPGLGGNAANLSGNPGKPIELIRGDISSGSLMEPLLKDCAIVFNLAGNVSHQDSMTDPVFDNELNTRAQITLLESCRKVNREAVIVFSSTRQIYGVPKCLPVTEDHPLQPIDINGINKLAAESYHSLYFRVHGMKVVSLRLTNTYGPRQLIKHSRQGFIGWFMNRALLEKEIHLYGGGEQLRDFTFVDDAVDAFLLAASTPACYGGIFNLSGERSSLAEVAGIFGRLCPKTKVRKVGFPTELKKIDIGDYYADSSKFFAQTRWTPEIKLLTGIAAALDYYRDKLPHYLESEE